MKLFKMTMSVICSVLLCMAMVLPTSAASTMIANERESLPLLNALANVQAVDGADAASLLASKGHPGVITVAVSELDDVTAFVKLCMETNTLPTLIAETPDEGEAVIDAMTDASCKDLNVISSNAAVLKNIRNKKSLARTGLIVDLPEGELTSEQAHEIRSEVRAVPATFCVIPLEDAQYASVTELRHLAVAVWVQVDTPADDEAFAADVLQAVTSSANGIITADSAKAAQVINDTLEENSMTRVPVMIGHRGNPSQAPENSISGFRKAYENGADVFEVDVEITKDGEVIIMHDDTIARTTDYDGEKRVNDMTLEEIRTYHLLAKDGSVSEELVPTLREVLEEFSDKDCRIFVEFKGSNENNVAATAKLIEEYDMADRVDVISFSMNLIGKTQQEMEGMSTGYLHSPYGSPKTYEGVLEILSASLYGAQSMKSSVNPSKNLITSMFMQAATERGMTVWPWTYTAQNNNDGFLLCPDGVTTDDMQWVTDMPQYVTLSDKAPTVGVGGTAAITVSAVTFGGEERKVSADDLIVKVIDGDDCVSVDNGVVTGKSNGTATVLYGVRAETTNHSDYVLYAQPVSITVGEDAAPWWIWLIVGGAAVIAAAVVAVVIRKKSKAK